MSDLEVFQFPATGQRIRTVLRGGEPWFVAVDVCAALAITDARQAVAGLDDDERCTVPVTDSLGREQQTYAISESGLYSLVLRSRKPEAKAFKRWVTHQVLPAIRKTGLYDPTGKPLPQSYSEALRELASTVERAEYAERELADAAPKAEAWQVLASTEGDWSVREAAYILNRDSAIRTGQNILFATLREWKMIDKGDRPYSGHREHIRLRAITYPGWDGKLVAGTQIRITAAGLKYLHRRLGGVEQLRFIVPSDTGAA